jgi:murein hydrolase activator
MLTGKAKYKKLLLLSAILLLPVFYLLFAQSDKQALQSKKQKLESEIKITNQQLSQTQKDKKNYINQLYLINKKIKQREELIQTIDEEVDDLDGQLASINDTISKLQNRIKDLKTEYAKLIYSTYRSRNSYNRMVFIFAAKDFNQAMHRIKYMHEYSIYRQEQAAVLVASQQQLGEKLQLIENSRNIKLGLKQNREIEVNNLSSEKDLKNKTVQSLSKKEKVLLQKLQENEAALNKLKVAIQAVIAEEIKKANEEQERRNNATPKSVPDKKNTPVVPVKNSDKKTPEPVKSMAISDADIALSNNFENNKGRLPWPVESGNVISTFGEHPHPDFKGIKVKNNGIDIAASRGARARAVFDGEVSSVMSIANLHFVVIVRHGNYLTVYSNLENVDVKKGDKVKTRQSIGKIFTDPDDGSTRLHFELWNGTVMQNPQIWVRQ